MKGSVGQNVMTEVANFLISSLLFHLTTITCLPADESHQHQFTSGVYHEELPPPILYDSFIPIIYEYQLPKWNKSEVTFNNWYSCQSETLPYKSCAIMYHLNKAVNNLHIDFESLQPVQDTISHSAYYESLFRTFTFCETIQKHFSGIYMQRDELVNYLIMLANCNAQPLTHAEVLSDFNYSITAPFNRMEVSFYETFFKPINATRLLETVATAVLSNSRSTIQSTVLAAYYAEKYRWVHALQDCQQQLLPHSLVSVAKLNETLIEMSKRDVFESDYEFAIPLELISKYYSLPLTDCTYTSNSFVVRLLFPVQLKTKLPAEVSMYRFHPAPFRYESSMCIVKSTWSTYTLYDFGKRAAYSTTCEPNSLCQSPQSVLQSNQDRCATALLNNDVNATKANCEFECQNYDSLNSGVLVTRVGSDKFVLTGRSTNDTITTKCPEISSTSLYSVDSTGATELTLPCKCQLSLEDGRRYFSEFPCELGNISLVHIEPWHLTNFNDQLNNSISHSIDSNLLVKYMPKDSVQTPSAGIGKVDQLVLAGNVSDTDTSSTFTSHTLIWITFLTISLLLLVLQVYVLYKLRLITTSSSYYQTRGNEKTDSSKTIDNLLYYKVGNRNENDGDEPEVHLLSAANA